MKIKRAECLNIINLIKKLKDKVFNIETQYKFLLIDKQCKEEEELYSQQLQFIIEKYGEKDDSNNLIHNESGGIKIQTEAQEKCLKLIKQLEKSDASFPDIYFSIDELDKLELTLDELRTLEPFIKI